MSASVVSAGRWQWRPALSGQERKKRRILRGRRSTFLVGLKRESRLAVHCAPRSCRMSQSVTATALTILSVHTRTHPHTSRERNGGTPLEIVLRVLFVVLLLRRNRSTDSFLRFQFYSLIFFEFLEILRISGLDHLDFWTARIKFNLYFVRKVQKIRK